MAASQRSPSPATTWTAAWPVVAAVAGFFIGKGFRPAPPGLHTLRAFQAAQGETARVWLMTGVAISSSARTSDEPYPSRIIAFMVVS